MSSTPPSPPLEAWLAGPVSGVPPILQPAAHALVQARQELASAVGSLDAQQLWLRPGEAASVGFHALHVAGSTDRLLTYARGQALSASQHEVRVAERDPPRLGGEELMGLVGRAIEAALDQLRATDPATLYDPRGVGRGLLPSNALGLIFHAAEHAQRHAGQAVTTAKIVRGIGL